MIKDVRVRGEAETNSDHYLVEATIRINNERTRRIMSGNTKKIEKKQ